MKPSRFEYHRPATVAEAVAVLAERGTDAKVLAGGQSLVPMLNMRLAAPKVLVDINRLGDELGSLDIGDATVRVGALRRHAALLASPVARLPILAQATAHVAHATIRNRGTTVGSIVHADPAGELPGVLLLCDGSVELASAAGNRTVAAGDFFLGPLESALRPGELAVAATFAVPPGHSGSAWVEVSRRAGDYALAGVGVMVSLDDAGAIASARAAFISVGPVPLLVDLTLAVGGSDPDDADWGAAGALALDAVEPDEDIHASADYRRHLVGVLTGRAGRAAALNAVARSEA